MSKPKRKRAGEVTNRNDAAILLRVHADTVGRATKLRAGEHIVIYPERRRAQVVRDIPFDADALRAIAALLEGGALQALGTPHADALKSLKAQGAAS